MPARQVEVTLPSPIEPGRRWNSKDFAAAEIEGALPWGTEEAVILDSLPDSARLRRLLRDLESLILTEGFLHLTTADIAERLRCSKTTLYLAGSSDDLFELVIRIWLARANDRSWRAYEQAEGLPSKLVAFVSATPFLFGETSYQFMRDLTAFAGSHRVLVSYERRRREVVEGIFREGIALGVFHPVHPELAADLMHQSADRIMEADFLASVGLSVREAFEQFLRLFEYGLIRQE